MTDPNAPASTLTVRELIAAVALAGLLADHISRADAVKFAPIAADGLIDALNGNGGTP